MSWPEVPIHTACIAAVDCINRTAPTVDYETPYKMIRTSNIRSGFIDTKNVKYVTEDVFERWTRRLVPRKGDVVVTREAPIGEVGRITTEENILLGQRIFHYRPDPNILDSNFLAYVLQSPTVQNRIKSVGSGSTVEHVRVGDCLNLLIPLPPLHIQKRIGDILSTYDDLIENNKRRIALLEQSARLLYKEWFVHFRFPGHEHVKMIDGIPYGWKKKKLEEVVSFLGRGITPRYDDEAECLVINQKCIRNHLLNLDLARRQSKEVPPEKLVRKGDILINSTGEGTLGRVAQVIHEIEKCTVDSHVTIVRPSPDIPKYFLGMSIINLEPVLSSMGKGATNQTELSRTSIAEINLIFPESHIVEEFERYSENIWGQIYTLSVQIKKLQEARDLLLPRLMKGEIQL